MLVAAEKKKKKTRKAQVWGLIETALTDQLS